MAEGPFVNVAMDSVKVGEFRNESESEQKWDHKGLTQIVQIIVSYGPRFIESLQFQYLKNGLLHTSEVIGRQDFSSPMFYTITFQSSNECITKVEGVCNSGSGGIEKLSIHTNIKTYEIFEAEKGQRLSYSTGKFSFNFGALNQFGGFHGTHTTSGLNYNVTQQISGGVFFGSYSPGGVRSIGVYFNRLTAPPPGYLQDQPRPTQEYQHDDEDHVDVNVH